MEYSLENLCSRFGYPALPERWTQIYPEAMADFEKGGCPWTREEYYEELSRKYGMLDGILDVYCRAAREVNKNEPLARLLHLVCVAERDRNLFPSEVKCFSFPSPRDDEDPFAYGMLGALALASMADYTYGLLTARNLPKEHIDYVMKIPEGPVRSAVKNGTRPVYSLFDWNQHAIDAKLFGMGRLQIHLHDKFGGYVSVFKSDTGELVSLADGIRLHRSGHALGALHFEDEEGSFEGIVTEGEDYYEGYPYLENGLVSPTPVRISKEKYTKVLARDSLVVKLHIPSGSPLDDAAVEDSLNRCREFCAKYYPDFEYKGFSCYSWLCDPQLIDLLGENTNISKFCKRFRALTVPNNGKDVFRFVFKNANIQISDIPTDTRLGRALKAHYESGKAIYDYRGFFLR